MSDGLEALTEKEKQTLRLVVRGYDAKSIARHFGLSVHTVNERLRYARRKMEVSSSREAARLLVHHEGERPDSPGDKQLGEAPAAPPSYHSSAPDKGTKAGSLSAWTNRGLVIMSLIIMSLVLYSAAQLSAPAAPAAQSAPLPAPTASAETDVVRAARQWLALVDAGRWDESWRATGRSFRQLNTAEKWASVSQEVRPPLGTVLSRMLRQQESVPAPPAGAEVVKFQTSFAHRLDTTETITLMKEGGVWRVVGYWIG